MNALRKRRWLVLAQLGLGLVGFGRRRRPRPAARRADPLDAALEERIRGKAGLEDVEIEASWQREPGNQSVRIWGSGVGIWQSEDPVPPFARRDPLAPEDALRRPGRRHAAAGPEEAGGPPAECAAPAAGELTVVAGSARRSLQQLTKGEQSGARSASSSPDPRRLRKGREVGRRRLEPPGRARQALEGNARARRRSRRSSGAPGRPKAGARGESWLLRMNGRRVTDRLMPKGQMPPPPRELTISEADFQRILRLLQQNDPTRLPKNVYAPAYTDLTVEILDQDRTVAARPYLGVTPETHGVEQQKFERIYDAFRALHQRVQAEGQPAADPAKPAPPTPSSPAAP